MNATPKCPKCEKDIEEFALQHVALGKKATTGPGFTPPWKLPPLPGGHQRDSGAERDRRRCGATPPHQQTDAGQDPSRKIRHRPGAPGRRATRWRFALASTMKPRWRSRRTSLANPL